MSDKPTIEEMVKHLVHDVQCECTPFPTGYKDYKINCIYCEAIREALTDSDIAHWMDRCYELKAKLAEKPVPRMSREDVEKAVQSCEQEFPIISKGWDIFEPVIVRILTELGIEVSDNSEVRRRTSDKEGE